jgi:peptide/nickel transport system permease protein
MSQVTLASGALPRSSSRARAVVSVPRGLRRALVVARREVAGVAGFGIVGGLVLLAVLAPVVAPYDPLQTGLAIPLGGPTPQHWLGTDSLGRDVLSRLIWGARISLTVSVLAVLSGTGLGVLIGLAGGYFGGWFDLLVQRVVDSLLAIPTLVLALALSATIGGSLTALAVVIAITLVPLTARVIRADTMVVHELQFIDAARSIGCGEVRMLLPHVLPSVLPNMIVLATLDLGVVMIVEASLSFLGIGVPAPAPSWGQMLSGAATQYFRQAPLLAILPGLAISLAVLGVNLAGDTLRNLLDPRLRRRPD